MFGVILDFCDKVKQLDSQKIMSEVFNDKDLQADIIDLNQSQLYNKGIQSDGTPTGTYTKKSIEFKKFKGQPYDHVTLKDTGEFYSTMNVKPDGDGFVINADMVKDDQDLSERWDKALGLTDESISEIIPEARYLIIEKVKNEIFS